MRWEMSLWVIYILGVHSLVWEQRRGYWHPSSPQLSFSSLPFCRFWIILGVCWRGATLFWDHSAEVEAVTRAKWEGKMPCGGSISMVTSGLSLHGQNMWGGLGYNLYPLNWKWRMDGRIRNLGWWGHIWSSFNWVSHGQTACPVQDWQIRGRRVIVENGRVTKMWQNEQLALITFNYKNSALWFLQTSAIKFASTLRARCWGL